LPLGTAPFRLTHGEEFYRHLDTHPGLDARFAQAMDSVEALADAQTPGYASCRKIIQLHQEWRAREPSGLRC
jgi:hypothetical protein